MMHIFPRNDHLHSHHRYLLSKRFITLLIICCAIFSVFFYRAVQIFRIRLELSRVRFLYRACQEKVKTLKDNVPGCEQFNATTLAVDSIEIKNMLKEMTGMKAATGFDDLVSLPPSDFVIPELKKDPRRLLPSYHVHSGRTLVDVVIGVTHVKRDKEDYLFGTLKSLVEGISEADADSTLLIILVGETDLQYIINTSRTIEQQFPEQVQSGLIEVISPSESYYPNLDNLPPSLGDPPKRVKWRTKEVLDLIYLMAYGRNKGGYYLMMEDDVLASKNYMQGMKSFINYCTAKEPEWVLIEYTHHFGSLGKLFRSSDVSHLLTYLQLFYYNMPLDFLVESYLRDRVCDITRHSKECFEALNKIRKKYPVPLFEHIGLYSSLPGKIGKVEDIRLVKGRQIFLHVNPPLKYIRSKIKELPYHTLKMAYEGKSMFLGLNPKSGDVIEFWFKMPTALKSFKFQSGNFERRYDIFFQTDVEVLPVKIGNFTKVGSFDEEGYVAGDLTEYGVLDCIRLKVIQFNWDITKSVVLSEIELLRL